MDPSPCAVVRIAGADKESSDNDSFKQPDPPPRTATSFRAGNTRRGTIVRVAGDAFGLIGEPDAPFARWDPAASSEPPVYRSFG
jgi:hypothetical protein